MDLTVQQLRMLREVSAQGTISAAASHLGFTPSAVSQQLSAVEKTTGVAVLTRVGRNVQLTDAGRELVGHADVVLAQLEEAQAAIERIHGTPSGVIRIGVMESVAAIIIPGVLRRLAAEYPEVELRTRQSEVDDSIESVRSGGLDATFAVDYSDSPRTIDSALGSRLVCRDWFRLVVPVGDALATNTPSLEDLSDRQMIASPASYSCGRCVTFACRAAGFEPNVVHELDDYTTSLMLVEAGAGVSLIPDLGLRGYVPDGVVIVPLKHGFNRVVELVHRESSANRPAFEAVASAIDAEADALGLDRS